MKNILLSAALLCGGVAFAQTSNNPNTLAVQVDGKEFKTEPRRIRMGTMWYITANGSKPDKSLRFWFMTPAYTETPEKGLYRIVDERYTSRRDLEKLMAEGTYKGVAYMKYVEETRAPRMEYHVGKSRADDGGAIEITASGQGFLEGTFHATLDGTHFKEKAGATVFGGVGRIMNKMEDKAVTAATGYDSDIDPEGRGYKRTDKTDEIVLKGGTFKLRMLKSETGK